MVYGPLVNGGTTLLFESTPTYPDPGRYWEMIEKHRVNQFYCAPTAVRLLLKYGDSYVKSRDLSSIKTIGSVGEPINPEAWHWLNDTVGGGRCDIVDTWWQTETGRQYFESYCNLLLLKYISLLSISRTRTRYTTHPEKK